MGRVRHLMPGPRVAAIRAPAGAAEPASLILMVELDHQPGRVHVSMVCVVLLVCLVFVGGCGRAGFSGSEGREVSGLLDRAKKQYEQRDYKGAIASYEGILRLRPENSDACFQIGMIYYFNLNDYLNAAYYYQRFLLCPNPDAGKVELAKGFMENAKLQFAASVPNSGSQSVPELVRLRTENDALHRQVEDLKRDLVALRSQSPAVVPPVPEKLPVPPSPAVISNAPPPKNEVKVIPPVKPTSPPKSPARPKTYTVRKGDGIQAIAERFYGDRSKWRAIVAANPRLKNPNRLAPGQVLVLP